MQLEKMFKSFLKSNLYVRFTFFKFAFTSTLVFFIVGLFSIISFTSSLAAPSVGSGKRTPISYSQSAYRWFGSQHPIAAFDEDGVIDGVVESGTAEAISKDVDYLYIAGSSSSSDWRLEKRDITTGALVTAFDSDGVVDGVSISGTAYGITNDNDYVYVAGYDSNGRFRLEKRDITTGALVTAFDSDGVVDGVVGSGFAFAITIDTNYLYVAGQNSNGTLRLEKRDITTGALVTAFDSDGVVDGAASSNSAQSITIDTNYLYVAGQNSNGTLRLEKRDITTGALVTAFDSDGVVDGVAASGGVFSITIDTNHLFTVGQGGAYGYWRLEKRDLTTGALVTAFDTDGVVDGVTASNTAYAVIKDANYLYIAGNDSSGNESSSDFRIEKRDIITGALANGTVANIDVGTPLANQDTIATAPVQGTPFRLRMNLHIGTRDLAQSGQSFKLQFAGKGAGSCAVPSGTPSSYTDVTTSTAIKYYDNSNPADGTAFTPNSGDPAHASDILKRQTYEEANNFTNSVSAINLGEDGMWDFALTDNTAPAGTSYCFRAVKSDGGALNTYTQYPEVVTTN